MKMILAMVLFLSCALIGASAVFCLAKGCYKTQGLRPCGTRAAEA